MRSKLQYQAVVGGVKKSDLMLQKRIATSMYLDREDRLAGTPQEEKSSTQGPVSTAKM